MQPTTRAAERRANANGAANRLLLFLPEDVVTGPSLNCDDVDRITYTSQETVAAEHAKMQGWSRSRPSGTIPARQEGPMILFYILIVLIAVAVIVGYIDSDPRKPPAGRK